MATSKNPVMLLKEYHEKMKQSNVAEPAYSVIQKVPNSFLCTYTYRNHSTEGTATSKKEARSKAALLMLEKLEVPTIARKSIPTRPPTPPEVVVSEVTKKLANEFLAKYEKSSNTAEFIRYPPSTEDLEVCFRDINFGLKSPDSPVSETLRKRLDREMHSITCFEQVMREMKLRFCAERMDVEPQYVGKAFVILLKIDFHCMVIGGYGETLEEAVEKACRNGLDAICLYMK